MRRHGSQIAGTTPATKATPGHTKSSRTVTSSSPTATSAATAPSRATAARARAAAAAYVVIPSVMVFCALILRPRVNRIVNIALSALYAATIIAGAMGEWS